MARLVRRPAPPDEHRLQDVHGRVAAPRDRRRAPSPARALDAARARRRPRRPPPRGRRPSSRTRSRPCASAGTGRGPWTAERPRLDGVARPRATARPSSGCSSHAVDGAVLAEATGNAYTDYSRIGGATGLPTSSVGTTTRASGGAAGSGPRPRPAAATSASSTPRRTRARLRRPPPLQRPLRVRRRPRAPGFRRERLPAARELPARVQLEGHRRLRDPQVKADACAAPPLRRLEKRAWIEPRRPLGLPAPRAARDARVPPRRVDPRLRGRPAS